jgi:hypothetical protein
MLAALQSNEARSPPLENDVPVSLSHLENDARELGSQGPGAELVPIVDHTATPSSPEHGGTTPASKRKRQEEGIVSQGIPIFFDTISHTQRSGNYLAEQGRLALEDALRNRERSVREERPRPTARGSRPHAPRYSSNISRSEDMGRGGDDSEGTSESSGRRRRRRNKQNKEMDMLRDILQNYDKRVKESIEAQRKCYGCNWTEGPKVETNDLSKVDEVFFAKYGKMDDDALCVLLEGVFNKKVRDPYRRRGIPIPDWPAPVIKEHYLFHMSDPDVIFTEVLKTFHTTFHEIRNSFFTETTLVKYTQDESEMDPETGEPVRYRHEEKHWEPNYKAIRCGMDLYKTLKDVVKLSSSEYAPERKRSRLKNMNPSLVCPERIQFGGNGASRM